MLPGIAPVLAGLSEVEPAILAFTYLGTATGANSTGAFSINFDIGAAHANKTVLVVGQVAYPSADTLTGFVSKTINGTAATQRAFVSNNDGTDEGIAAWIIMAAVSAAGTVAIAGLYPLGVAGHTRIDVYTTTQSVTVVEALTGSDVSAVSPIQSQVLIDVSEGGTVIAGCSASTSAQGMSWTGVTEIYDADFSAEGRVSGGHSGGLSAQSNRQVLVSQTITGNSGVVFAAISLVKTA